MRTSNPTALLFLQLRALCLPLPTTEFRFHAARKWRFDLAWVPERLALEIQGGLHVRGKHSRAKGIENDMEKFNEAQICGWSLLLCSPDQIVSGQAVKWVRMMLPVAKVKAEAV